MPSPYANAPRLPEGDGIDLRRLVHGEWLEVEIGPGRGGFLVERAEIEPRAALVGLETRRKWASVVDERLARRGLGGRVRVLAEDAALALPRIGPQGCLERVFIHFPDPWWKRRHWKRLVVKDRVLDEAARLLVAGGELFIQTDVLVRACAYEELVSFDRRFEMAGDTPATPRLSDNPYVARSPRERRAMADGLPIYRMRWRRASR